MKRKIFTYLSIMAGAMLSGGCFQPNEEQIPHNEGRTVSITAGQSEVTRAYVSSVGASESTTQAGYSLVWDAEDAIGVYLSGPTTESNCKFTSTSGKGASEATFTGKFQSDATSGTHTYYAYSPYNANAGSDPTAVSGALSATQIQSNTEGTHIGKYMLEIAKATASDNGGTSLTFQNQFSILNFKIKYRAQGVDGETEDFSGVKVSAVRVFVAEPSEGDADMIPLFTDTYKLAGSYTIDITADTPTVNISKDSYSWIVECSVTNDTEVKGTTDKDALDVWMVVNPVNIGDKKLVAEIVTDRGVFQTSRSIKSNGGQLKPNAVYVLPATIKTPKVTPQIYPLWTEEKTANTFFETLQLNGAVSGSATELQPSNCFVVKPGTLYKFNANIRGRGAAGLEAMGLSEDSFVGDYSVRIDGSISSLLGDEDYIYFKTTEAGNAVITLYFGGTALWSWHIWSIDDTLNDVQVGNGIYMLDRNLGARQALSPSLVNAAGNFHTDTAGLYYCWGFNVPYPGTYGYLVNRYNRPYNPSVINKNLYNYYYDGGTATLITSRYIVPALSLSTSIMAPYAPADLTSNTETDVNSDEYLRMWGYSEDGVYKKTAFDPCPYGYMVPPQSVFGQYNTGDYAVDEAGVSPSLYKNQVTVLNYGESVTYLPEMGLIGLYSSDTASSWRHQGQGMAYYWTATPAEVSKSGGAMTTGSYNPDTNAFGSSFVNAANNRRAIMHYFQCSSSANIHFHYAISRFQGCPVRCVRCSEESGSPTK